MKVASSYKHARALPGSAVPLSTRREGQVPCHGSLGGFIQHASVTKSSHRGNAIVANFKLTSDSRVTKREQDLAQRKKYLTDFWYAAGFSAKLQHGKVTVTKLLDTEVVLWRDVHTKTVHCITDKSPITGESLSPAIKEVKMRQQAPDTMSVGGITYDMTTGCAIGTMAAPLEVWDCVEQEGFIWLWFGDRDIPRDMRVAVPSVPELSLPGWHAVHGEVFINNNHWTVIENVIDMAHVPYVHKGTVGNHAAFVDIDIERTDTAMNFSFPIENHRANGEDAVFRVDTIATACLPSTSFIRFTFPFNLRLVTINSVVPIDEKTTCIRFCQMRNFLQSGIIDPVVSQGMKNILGEDKVILEQLTPHEVTNEISLKADAPQLALRNMRAKYISMGKAVDPGPRPLYSMPKWKGPETQI